MPDYSIASRSFLLLTSSSAILGTCLIYLLMKSQYNPEENKSMPHDTPPINDTVCGLALPDPKKMFSGITSFFTKSISPERKAREDLEKLVKQIYQGELNYTRDMRDIDQLRMGLIDDQQKINTNLRQKILVLTSSLPASSEMPSDRLHKTTVVGRTELSTLEDSQKKLQAFKDEWNRYELPDLQFRKLSLADMTTYKRQLEDDVLTRNKLHKSILEAALEHLKLRTEQYERARNDVSLKLDPEQKEVACAAVQESKLSFTPM